MRLGAHVDAASPPARKIFSNADHVKELFREVAAEPLRVIVGFWQVISSFSDTLYVPWPAVYYHYSSGIDVARLQFLALPKLACITPEPSFFKVFDATTIACFTFIVLIALSLHFGMRSEVVRKEPKRGERFRSRCLLLLTWGVFLAYPQVAQTTLSIYSCTTLENGTQWLSVDCAYSWERDSLPRCSLCRLPGVLVLTRASLPPSFARARPHSMLDSAALAACRCRHHLDCPLPYWHPGRPPLPAVQGQSAADGALQAQHRMDEVHHRALCVYGHTSASGH